MTHDPPAPPVRAATVDDLPSIRVILFAAHNACELACTEQRDLEHLFFTVEARNTHALAMYERTGFARDQEWPRWAKPTGQPAHPTPR